MNSLLSILEPGFFYLLKSGDPFFFSAAAVFAIALVVTILTTYLIIKYVDRTRMIAWNPRIYSQVPRLGGLPVFIGLASSMFLWFPGGASWNALLIALLIIFSIGFWDDLVDLNPWIKLGGQLLATLCLIFFFDMRILSLFGMLGVGELPYAWSVGITLITVLTIINSMNLIDGINGLSGSIAALCCSILGVWFFLSGHHLLGYLSLGLLGGIIGFLYFNWTPAKIYLGDSGSLLLGTLLSVFVLRFLNFHHLELGAPYNFQSAPVVALSLLMLPLFDTVRVFLIRLSQGGSPLQSDRNHIHHRLLDAGYSHSQSTIILLVTQFIFVLLALGFNELAFGYYALVMAAFIFSIYFAFLYLISFQKKS